MRVLLTGGSGFTGEFVLSELARRGHDVVALARSTRSADVVAARGAEPVWGDLDDAAAIDVAMQTAKADCLVNLASLGFGHAPTIVTAAENAGLRRAVFVSTTAIFTKLNASSKTVRVAAEDTIRASELDWTIIRPTMIYGTDGDRNISRLVKLARKAPIIPLPGDGERMQQPVHVEDLARTIVNAAERDIAVGKAYNVAGPEPIAFDDMVRLAGESVGASPRVARIPLGAARRAIGLYERVSSNPRLKVEQIDRLDEDKVFDISDAQADLDHDPRSFEKGLNKRAKDRS